MRAIQGISLSPAEILTLCLFGVLICLVALMGWRAWKASRASPDELERRRRKMLMAGGKMGDASFLDFRDGNIFYSYDVRGVRYTASQDLSLLLDYLPADPASMAGAVAVRYDARNPANSIILSEEWSGLHTVRPHTLR